MQKVAEINRFATQGLVPDRTLLLAVSPELGRARIRSRSAVADRLEREREEFFMRVAVGYGELAASDPQRIRSVDANEPPDRVLEAAIAQLTDLFPLGADSSRH
jgi:dTMP kinase